MNKFKKHGPFKSVKELVNNSLPKNDAKEINNFISEHSFARFLVRMRIERGVTEEELGKRMCLDSDDILELESSSDSEISIKTAFRYLEALFSCNI